MATNYEFTGNEGVNRTFRRCRELEQEVERLRAEIDILRTRLRGLEIDYSAEQVECGEARRLLREITKPPETEPSPAGFPRAPDARKWRLQWVPIEAWNAAKAGGE